MRSSTMTATNTNSTENRHKKKSAPEGALIPQDNNTTTSEKSERKRIVGYEDYYIYEDGRVFSTKTDRFLKYNVSSCGYPSVELFNSDGSARKTVHRLVAEAFIPNPNNYPQINHIDENKLNPSVENLEWCTAKYNMNYGIGAKTRHSKIDYSAQERKDNMRAAAMKRRRPVEQYDREGNLVARYDSGMDAERALGIRYSVARIIEVCRGKRKTAYNYIWKYSEV